MKLNNFVRRNFHPVRILLYLCFFVGIYLFLMREGIVPFFIPRSIEGRSMLPSYKEGDNIFTKKVIPLLIKYELTRGVVVIFKKRSYLNDDGLVIESNYLGSALIKRIIGIPGDKIVIKNGVVYLNDYILSEDYIYEKYTNNWEGGFTEEGISYTIPENNYFVMGDNRAHSSDSREYGFIPWYQIDSIVITKPRTR